MDLNPDDEQRFLAEKPSWLRKLLQADWSSITRDDQAEMLRCNWIELWDKTEAEYLEVLKRFPDKLRAHRRRVARLAAKNSLSTLPSPSPGAPRGMRKETRDVAQRLIELMKEFENKNGTRRGALDYATKKVYVGQDKHARIQRGQQAVRRYKKALQNPKPPPTKTP